MPVSRVPSDERRSPRNRDQFLLSRYTESLRSDLQSVARRYKEIGSGADGGECAAVRRHPLAVAAFCSSRTSPLRFRPLGPLPRESVRDGALEIRCELTIPPSAREGHRHLWEP